MARSTLPFYYHATPAAQRLLGLALPRVAAAALRAVVLNRKTLEIAHQQISYNGQPFALASRVSSQGDVIIEIDVGDERLAGRLILEDELKAATRDARDRDHKQREADRKLRQRRW